MNRTVRFIVLCTPLLFTARLGATEAEFPKNDAAVAEVLAGTRTEANAAWWGFDRQDATEVLQAAINSGAKKLFVPDLGHDWIVRPLRLVSNQEIILEPGVVLSAKRGEYRGRSDYILTARAIENVTIRGYGATVRMNKQDYMAGMVLNPEHEGPKRKWFGHYEKAEGRHAFSIRGCTNIDILGLTIRDSGGDGIYIAGGSGFDFCKNVHIKDVVCDNNYRQGISIISAVDLLVEDSRFENTWGTAPSAGVDIEPNEATDKLQNITFRNCQFNDNFGEGIELYLISQRNKPDDISILFDRCSVTSRWGQGIRVGKLSGDGPSGHVTFRDCTVRDTAGYGIRIDDKAQNAARVRFVRCELENVACDAGFNDPWTPIWLHPQRAGKRPIPDKPHAVHYQHFGGIDFIDCTLRDAYAREAISTHPALRSVPLHDITGQLAILNPHGVQTYLSENQSEIDLKIELHAQSSEAK